MMGDEKEKFVALKLLQVLVKIFERECVCVCGMLEEARGPRQYSCVITKKTYERGRLRGVF